MSAVRIPIDLDSQVFWKLAELAELRDMKVNEYMVELAEVASRRKLHVDSDPVVRLWRQGKTDRQICADLGMTRAAVGDRRRSFGLPANHPPRKSRITHALPNPKGTTK